MKTSENFAGMLATECKQVYFEGFMEHLEDMYNALNWIILSLYVASYTARLIVNTWVRSVEMSFNATSTAEALLEQRNYKEFVRIVYFWKSLSNGTQSPYNNTYFLEACMTCDYFLT